MGNSVTRSVRDDRNVALIYVRVSRVDEDERARKVSPDVQRREWRSRYGISKV
jgi:hypothetical protein